MLFRSFEDRSLDAPKEQYTLPHSSPQQTVSTQLNSLTICSPDSREYRNGSKQTDTDTDAALDSSGVLDLLDAVTSPLSHAQTLLESALALSHKLQEHTTICLRSGLKWVAQAMVGVRSLHVAAKEVL